VDNNQAARVMADFALRRGGIRSWWPTLVCAVLGLGGQPAEAGPSPAAAADMAFIRGFEALRYGDREAALEQLLRAWSGGLRSAAAARVLGEAALLDGRPEAAVDPVLRGLELNSTDRGLGVVAVQVLGAAGRAADAAAIGAELLGRPGWTEEPALALAVAGAARVAGEGEAARRLLEQAAASEGTRARAWLALAELALEAGCRARADSLVELVRGLDPNAEIGRGLAELDRALGHHDRARAELSAILLSDRADGAAAIALAALLADAGRHDAATAELGATLEAGAGQPVDLLAALAEHYAARGASELAAQWADAALTEARGRPTRRLRAISALIEIGQIERAHRGLVALAAALPGDPRPWLRLAEIERALGGSGASRLGDALQRQPGSAAITLRYARALREEGEIGEALRLLDDRSSDQAVLERVRSLLKVGSAAAALGELEALRASAECNTPWEPDLWSLRARALAEIGDEDQARAAAGRALAAAGDRWEIFESVSITMRVLGDEEAELATLSDAAQRCGDEPDLYRRLARAWIRRAAPDSARRALHAGRAARPEDLGLVLMQAELAKAELRPHRADVYYRKVADAAEVMLDAELERARILRRIGIAELAAEAARRATEIDPGCLLCWDELWQILAELDRSGEAVRAAATADSLRRASLSGR